MVDLSQGIIIPCWLGFMAYRGQFPNHLPSPTKAAQVILNRSVTKRKIKLRRLLKRLRRDCLAAAAAAATSEVPENWDREKDSRSSERFENTWTLNQLYNRLWEARVVGSGRISPRLFCMLDLHIAAGSCSFGQIWTLWCDSWSGPSASPQGGCCPIFANDCFNLWFGKRSTFLHIVLSSSSFGDYWSINTLKLSQQIANDKKSNWRSGEEVQTWTHPLENYHSFRSTF